jgi:hypothetical protein
MEKFKSSLTTEKEKKNLTKEKKKKKKKQKNCVLYSWNSKVFFLFNK